jgi:hypothetical protein
MEELKNRLMLKHWPTRIKVNPEAKTINSFLDGVDLR